VKFGTIISARSRVSASLRFPFSPCRLGKLIGSESREFYTGARVAWGEGFPNLDEDLAVKYFELFFEV
jgi:hypothetical protein